MPFDPGIIILGLGCLALLAGLGAWIWEYIKTPKAAESARNGLEISAPAPSTKTSANTPGPAIQTAPPESSHPPQPVSPTATALPPLLPQPVPTPVPPLPPSAIQQVELKQENVDADATYETTLAEVQPADPPEPPPIAPPPVLGAGDENEKNILSCTGTVLWRSPDEDNGKTIGTIERAIFRDSFQTLKLELRYPNRDWPAELTMRRDTTSSYTGQAGTQSTDVHCQLVFNTLSGTKIGFKGLWYAYRTDTQACETFHVTGEIHLAPKLASCTRPRWILCGSTPRSARQNPKLLNRPKLLIFPPAAFPWHWATFAGIPFWRFWKTIFRGESPTPVPSATFPLESEKPGWFWLLASKSVPSWRMRAKIPPAIMAKLMRTPGSMVLLPSAAMSSFKSTKGKSGAPTFS